VCSEQSSITHLNVVLNPYSTKEDDEQNVHAALFHPETEAQHRSCSSKKLGEKMIRSVVLSEDAIIYLGCEIVSSMYIYSSTASLMA